MPTLLEQAKQIKTKPQSKISSEQLELVEAYLNGEISTGQLKKVTNNQNGVGYYVLIATAARILWQQKKIEK